MKLLIIVQSLQELLYTPIPSYSLNLNLSSSLNTIPDNLPRSPSGHLLGPTEIYIYMKNQINNDYANSSINTHPATRTAAVCGRMLKEIYPQPSLQCMYHNWWEFNPCRSSSCILHTTWYQVYPYEHVHRYIDMKLAVTH